VTRLASITNNHLGLQLELSGHYSMVPCQSTIDVLGCQTDFSKVAYGTDFSARSNRNEPRGLRYEGV